MLISLCCLWVHVSSVLGITCRHRHSVCDITCLSVCGPARLGIQGCCVGVCSSASWVGVHTHLALPHANASSSTCCRPLASADILMRCLPGAPPAPLSPPDQADHSEVLGPSVHYTLVFNTFVFMQARRPLLCAALAAATAAAPCYCCQWLLSAILLLPAVDVVRPGCGSAAVAARCSQ